MMRIDLFVLDRAGPYSAVCRDAVSGRFLGRTPISANGEGEPVLTYGILASLIGDRAPRAVAVEIHGTYTAKSSPEMPFRAAGEYRNGALRKKEAATT